MQPAEFELYGHRFRWTDAENVREDSEQTAISLIRMRDPFPSEAVEWLIRGDGYLPGFGKLGDCSAYEFEGVASFLFPSDGRYLKIFIDPSAGHAMLEFVLFRGVLPRILHLRGTTCLHASAVAMAGGAVAFCGPSGAGKSTLAAALVSRGHSLVSDDVLPLRLAPAVNRVDALPGLPELRLCRDSAERLGLAGQVSPPLIGQTKTRWQPRRAPDSPLPLLGIYLLEPTLRGSSAQPAALLPLSKPEALIALISNSFWVHPGQTRALGKDMLCLGALLRAVRVEKLLYDLSDTGLAAVENLITKGIRATAA